MADPYDHNRADEPEPESTGLPGRNLAPTGRGEQIALVTLGALAMIVTGVILVQRAMDRPAPFHGAPAVEGSEALYRIDINTATESELLLLPGIGAALAARIVRSRESVGEFAAVDDLARVRGVTPETIERLRPLVRTDPEPIAPWK